MKLTAENVNRIFNSCLKGQDKIDIIEVHGVRHFVGFKQTKLKEFEKDIIDMLNCLPDGFKKSKGGGLSFVQAVNDNNDDQWADLHETVDELVCLGLSVGKIQFLLPREEWNKFYGGMPYFAVLD